MANAMLKVKNISSRKAGIGKITIASVAKTMTGAPTAGIARFGSLGSLSEKGKENFINQDCIAIFDATAKYSDIRVIKSALV